MTTFDLERVKKIQTLASLDLTPAEQDRLAGQLSNILHFVEQLAEVDTTGVRPLANVSEITLKLREDEVTDGGYQSDILANAPESMEGFFVVPRVVE